MRLHDDWLFIIRHSWCIRLLAIAGLLSGGEVALPMIQPYVPLPPGLLALLSALVTGAAFVARIVAQKAFEDDSHGS